MVTEVFEGIFDEASFGHIFYTRRGFPLIYRRKDADGNHILINEQHEFTYNDNGHMLKDSVPWLVKNGKYDIVSKANINELIEL